MVLAEIKIILQWFHQILKKNFEVVCLEEADKVRIDGVERSSAYFRRHATVYQMKGVLRALTGVEEYSTNRSKFLT